MGRSTSKEEGDRHEQEGEQLYVSLKMENRNLTGDLVPHVYGSFPLVASWDPSKAVILLHTHLSIFLPIILGPSCSYLFGCCCKNCSFPWNVNRPQCGSWALLFHLIMVMLSHFLSVSFFFLNLFALPLSCEIYVFPIVPLQVIIFLSFLSLFFPLSVSLNELHKALNKKQYIMS